MKTRIFASMLVIALAAALVGGATMAWFTDQESNENNTFAAGTLTIAVGTQTYAVPINNIAPGDSISGSFVITNTGSLNLKYRVTATTTGDLFAPGGAVVNITAGLAEGTIDAADPDQSVTITYTVSMPTTAGNVFQGDTGTLRFTVDATQIGNPGWGE